jgi:cytochrome c oxidase assembly protein subunit 15
VLGALIGIFVFVTAVVSLPYWRRDKPIFWLAVGGWLLTGVQGWLGSLVVSTNLLPIMVTIHMGLALLIVAMLLYAANRAQAQVKQENINSIERVYNAAISSNTNGVYALLWITLFITFIQIVLGTQVREQIDQVASASDYVHRDSWVSQLGSIFKVHRSMSVLVSLLSGYIVYLLWPTATAQLRRLLGATLGLLGLEIVAGVVLAYFALPAIVQPVHLTLATLLFGAQFLTLVTWQQVKTTTKQAQPQPAHA